MVKYVPTAITFAKSGLVKDRDAFVLADDAYQNLKNCYQWRGRIRRRQGYRTLGRLRRLIAAEALTDASGAQILTRNPMTSYLVTDPNGLIQPGTLVLTVDTDTFSDDGEGQILDATPGVYQLIAPVVVTGISNAAQAVLTCNATGFTGATTILIVGVVGMEEINGQVLTIVSSTATTITVSLNTTSYGTYVSGGVINASYLNYSTGNAVLSFKSTTIPPAATSITADFAYYPNRPVMGMDVKQVPAINAEETIAYDTRYAYRFSNSANAWAELVSTTATTWSGSNSSFFWSLSYWQTSAGTTLFWTTNFSGTGGDPIRVYNNTTWQDLTPTLTAGVFLFQARMLFAYKGRMLALNTYEGGTLAGAVHYPWRARWCQVGAPLDTSVSPYTATTEWRTDVKGRGGFVDCPTAEHIICAEFIRDILIVSFESSTWALRFTGNDVQPFVWDRINKELGGEATFSMVAFDKGVLYIGDKTINSCDGNNVDRIDENIPDFVFSIHNGNDGPARVHGIRDFYERVVYWTYPDSRTDVTFPNRVLVLNYQNQTYATFTDSFTCFGTHQAFNDVTWADVNDITWEEYNKSWISAQLQSQFPATIAGNQQGYTLVLQQQVANDQSLYIEDVALTGGVAVITSPNHNLLYIFGETGEEADPPEYVRIEGCIGAGDYELNNRIFQVVPIDADTFSLLEHPRTTITAISKATKAVVTCPGHTFTVGQAWYIDRVQGMTSINGLNGTITAVSGNTVTLDVDSSAFGTYTSGGEIQNLSVPSAGVVITDKPYLGGGVIKRVMGFIALSKKFNMLDGGQSARLGYMDFVCDVTDAGEFAVDIQTDYNDSSQVNSGNDTFFNNTVSTQLSQFAQPGQTKAVNRFYCHTTAQFWQYQLRLNDAQLSAPNIVDADWLVDGVIVYSSSGGRLVD